MNAFVESLKRLYIGKKVKKEQLDHLFSVGKLSKEEYEYILRKGE